MEDQIYKLLSDKELKQFLDLYHDEFKVIKNAKYYSGSVIAELIPFKYTFTVEDLDYLTATQISLYLSQLTYILMAKSIEDKEYMKVSASLYNDFFEQMYNGRLFFVKLSQRMKKMISKSMSPITMEMRIVGFKKVKNTMFCSVNYNICNDYSTGELLISMKN